MKHRNELKKLAKKLRKLPSEKFEMNIWINNKATDKRITCNTAGCAIGWLPRLVPETKLKLKRQPSINGGDYYYKPHYRGFDHYEAVSAYFEIDIDHIWHLFSADEYSVVVVSPTMVADRIDEFLKDNP